MGNKTTQNHDMNTKPQQRKFALPNLADMLLEDGTVYHVRSFFTGDETMGDVLDALTLEKFKRAM